jgi:hypothetical protein
LYPIRTICDGSASGALLQKYPDNFETTVVADIASSDLKQAIKGTMRPEVMLMLPH